MQKVSADPGRCPGELCMPWCSPLSDGGVSLTPAFNPPQAPQDPAHYDPGWHHLTGDKMAEDKNAVIQWVLAQCESSPVLPSSQPEVAHLKLAFLPGTGERQSAAICSAFAKAGFHTIVASRTLAKAEHRAAILREECPRSCIEAATFADAAASADVVFWMVPITTVTSYCHVGSSKQLNALFVFSAKKRKSRTN